MPNVLLVYPEFPLSFWGFQYALPFVGKKAAMPPLGLLTVAGMFPRSEYNLRVVDMNAGPLRDEDIVWADAVFTSSMLVQKKSLYEVAERCNRAGVPIVAGGPHVTSYIDEIRRDMRERGFTIDHLFCGEAEDGFLEFLQALRLGRAPDVCGVPVESHDERKRERLPLSDTPVPRYDLVNLHQYGSASSQSTRGCPLRCGFCDIPALFGGRVRAKTDDQMIREFQFLYELGWRGSVFLVDDNFVGKLRDAMRILRAIASWQKEHGYPFSLYTEADVNIAEYAELVSLMPKAGMSSVFMGIESPGDEALRTSDKKQNVKRGKNAADYLLDVVYEMYRHGISVTAGFIIGLDGDREFDSHIRFIQKAGIAEAMVGLLTVLKGAPLYKKFQDEGRLLGDSTGNNTDAVLNFIPELPREHLIAEYKRVTSFLYDPELKNYFERSLTLFQHLQKAHRAQQVRKVGTAEVGAFFKSMWYQLLSKQGPAYAHFLWNVAKEFREFFPVEAVALAVKGFHFQYVAAAIAGSTEVPRVF